MRVFGSADEHSLTTIIGWLESQIENEADKAITSAGVEGRLDTAYEALELLVQVDEWTPQLTREWRKRQRATKIATPRNRKAQRHD